MSGQQNMHKSPNQYFTISIFYLWSVSGVPLTYPHWYLLEAKMRPTYLFGVSLILTFLSTVQGTIIISTVLGALLKATKKTIKASNFLLGTKFQLKGGKIRAIGKLVSIKIKHISISSIVYWTLNLLFERLNHLARDLQMKMKMLVKYWNSVKSLAYKSIKKTKTFVDIYKEDVEYE